MDELMADNLKQRLAEVQAEAATMRLALTIVLEDWRGDDCPEDFCLLHGLPDSTDDEIDAWVLRQATEALATNAGVEILEALRFYAQRGCGRHEYGKWIPCPIDFDMGARARKALGMGESSP